jgi:hypothetical protein
MKRPDHTLAVREGLWPYRGPCAFCGSPDSRHRLFDTLRAAPEADTEVAREYRVPVGLVRIVREPTRRPANSDWRRIVP